MEFGFSSTYTHSASVEKVFAKCHNYSEIRWHFRAAAGAEKLRECHRPWIENAVFVIPPCPRGQVIHIRSALIEQRTGCRLSGAVCSKDVIDDPDVASCNGQRSCGIYQSILNNYRCTGNFINIVYDCGKNNNSSVFNFCCLYKFS